MPRKAEVAWQCAVFWAPVLALDVHPLDCVPFLYVIYILQEVQIQVKPIGGLYRIWQLFTLYSTICGLGRKAICWNTTYILWILHSLIVIPIQAAIVLLSIWSIISQDNKTVDGVITVQGFGRHEMQTRFCCQFLYEDKWKEYIYTFKTGNDNKQSSALTTFLVHYFCFCNIMGGICCKHWKPVERSNVQI